MHNGVGATGERKRTSRDEWRTRARIRRWYIKNGAGYTVSVCTMWYNACNDERRFSTTLTDLENEKLIKQSDNNYA